MSVTPACIAAVVDASQGAMRDDQAAELIRYMETLRRAEEAKGNLDQLDARLRQRAREQADSARIAAALAQKHAALAAVKHAEALTHIDMLVKAGLPRDTAYLAFFEGTTRNVAGGRASVAATALAYTARHMERINRFLVDTPEAGRLVQRADKPFAEAVVREMEKPGSTGDSLAAATARAYSETAELVRQDLVRLGAPIGKLEGWRPQTHNAERVVRVSADEWIDYILPRLDMDRSLPGLPPTLVRETLRDIHRAIITGVERVPSTVEAGEKLGPANLANSLAQARVLHFKDSDAWLSYAERFGSGNIHEAMLGHLRQASRAAALMERLGPNPGAADIRIREALRRQAAEDDSLAPRERARLSKALDSSNTSGRISSAWAEASGLTSSPAAFGAAQLGTQIRAVQSWSKLAGAVVSSLGDLATRASALHYQGQPLAAAWRDSIAEVFNRSRDAKALAAMVNAGLDGMHGHLAAAGVAEDMPLGKIARVNAAFYRWQGMTWWSDMAKAGTGRMLMRWMGDQSGQGFTALPVEYRRVLRQHGIGPDQWELIRATAFQAEDGQTYVAPDRIGAIALPRFARAAAPALQAMEKGLAERAAARATADAREAGWVRSRVAKFEAGLERARRHWQEVSTTAEGSRNARVQQLRARMDELDLRLSEVAEFHDALADGRAWDTAMELPAAQVATGEARYAEIDGRRYVVLDDGSPDLASTDRVAAQAGIDPAPIRLPEGWQDPDGEAMGRGEGEKHVIHRHGRQIERLGYRDVADFVRDIAETFNEVRRDTGGGVFLIRRNPAAAAKRDTQPALVVHLKRTADGSAWEVHTAGPFTNIYVGKRELLWQGERSAPTRPAGQAAPSFTLPREEPGAAALPSARGQSDGDIGAAAPPRNPDPGGAAPGPDQPGAVSVSGGFRPKREGYLAEGNPATLAARQEGELRARLDRLRRTIGQINRAAKGADVERLEAFDLFWRGKAAELDAFVRQVEDRAKARAAATLADKFEWEPRVQTALGDARRELEMSVRRFFADEMRFGFIEPDAASRRIAFQGTRPGTVTGEAMRFLMQFKGYPIAFTQRVLGRAVQGAGGEAIPGGGPADRMWGAQARHIGGLLAGLIVTGYLAMTVKDLIRGYGPRDPAEPKTILAALMQSGGAGIYGDFLFAQANRFGTGALGTVAGPTAGTAGSILDLWPKLRDGDAKAGEALNLALQNTPFINMWYAKPVLDFLILNALREGLSPGFLARQERDRREKFGQDRWMPTTAWR